LCSLSGRLTRDMRNFLPPRSALLLVIWASAAMAHGRDPNVWSAYVRGRSNEWVRRLNVTPEAVTVLRFQQPCDKEGTKILGWEGRFEPVECAGKKVLIEPLQALDPEDRFLLVVTLADGTEVPFTLMRATRKEGEWPDQQVNVFVEPDTRESLQKDLEETRKREESLVDSVKRFYEEDTADHALAKLLVTGDIKQTSFIERKKRIVKSEDGAAMVVRIYGGKTKGKRSRVWLG
jgi:uncharacterized protein (TIGR02268 family)